MRMRKTKLIRRASEAGPLKIQSIWDSRIQAQSISSYKDLEYYVFIYIIKQYKYSPQ